MDINNEVENMDIKTWDNADESVRAEMLKKVTESDNGEMISCNSITCDNIITENGGYYEDTLKEFLVSEGIIDSEDDYDEDEVGLILGIKYTNVVVHTQELPDIEYNQETKEIVELGTTSTNYTLYCNKQCAEQSFRSFLIMKKSYQENK